ncbi:hypothetical protein [Xenorhabdus lircayensis]|uniref:TMhelix containing protein n=1 Tax=Xenorhabdus lircayensis TaxID=2763499 RepID=A0ABS0U8N0_9GAMM|nr:hypothetical protein [Xenorhabdus lircayensis]MBI6550229.1 hypothetical protein [Xenorhabdus lircayensis]
MIDSTIAIFVLYVLGYVGTLIISVLIEKRAVERYGKEPEAFFVLVVVSVVWPFMVVTAPIAFGLSFLTDKYNKFVGK